MIEIQANSEFSLNRTRSLLYKERVEVARKSLSSIKRCSISERLIDYLSLIASRSKRLEATQRQYALLLLKLDTDLSSLG